MKYNWEIMSHDDKLVAVARELRLVTHRGITKDDLIEMIKFLNEQYHVMERAFSITFSSWVKSLDLCILDLEGYDTKPAYCPDSPSHEDCCEFWKDIVMSKAMKEIKGQVGDIIVPVGDMWDQ